MSNGADQRQQAESVSISEWVDEIADQFEAAWQGVRPPEIAHFLGDENGPRRAALLAELIKVDMAYRAKVGDALQLADYRVRFPELGGRAAADVATPLPDKPLPAATAKHWPRIAGYEILGELGQGGMGVVYKARHVHLKRIVALKMISSRAHTDARALSRFRKEMEAVARLQHPNIVQIYEVGEQDGRPYCALEYVERGSLAQKLAGAPQPPRHAAQLVETLAHAVHYAHQHNVVHRDLKPANILLASVVRSPSPVAKETDIRVVNYGLRTTDYGLPKITDFGLAKQLSSDFAVRESEAPAEPSYPTLSGEIVGTPSYMAPEQAEARPGAIGPLADVYSLGAILYEFLTGRPPFKGETTLDTLEQVRTQEPVPPRRLQPRLPRDLETICLKAMAKSPARRYATAAELAEDLHRFLEGQPIHARPVGAIEKVSRWCWRNPTVAGLVAAVAVSLLAGTGTASYFAVRAVAEGRETLLEQQRADKQQQIAKEMDRLRGVAEEQRAEADKQRALVRRHLYLSNINLAWRAWEEGHVGRMDELLQKERPEQPGPIDFRGFEWYYLWRLRQQNQVTLKGHTKAVQSVAFSPDGQRLASGSDDRTVKVWDVLSGREILTLNCASGVNSIAFSPDGRHLASAASDETVRIWDATTGREVLRQEGHTEGVLSVAFSPDGRRLAGACQDQTVRVWDAATCQEALIITGHTGAVTSVAFSPDGRCLASASHDGTVRLWDTSTGQSVRILKGHTNWVSSVAFSTDGGRLASASSDLKIWDTATGRELLTLKGHTGGITSVAFSPDGRRLASAAIDRTLGVWDATDGQQLFSLKGHTNRIYSVAFSPDGRRLASGSLDRAVKLWDVPPSQEALTVRGHTDGVAAIAFSSDSRHLASGSLDRTVRLWNTKTGEETLCLRGHTGAIRSIAFSRDGQRLASAAADRMVKVWDVGTGRELLTLQGHTEELRSVAFSPDGQFLASGSLDNLVKLWNATTGRELRTLRGHTRAVRSVAFSPDGRFLASAARDGTVRIWEPTTGEEALVFYDGYGGNWVSSAVFSPDGRYLASGSSDLYTLKIWDRATGQEFLVLRGHTGGVTGVAFSPDGRRLASASYDRTVKVWDVTTGQEILSLKGHTACVGSVAFSHDGHHLASASYDGTVKIWDATPLDEKPRSSR